jgi:uroporphyrin-III C-methyltransferase/precorrin-2 dehydrogenase/sirohydrochlorin ferrochelatase
MFPAFLHLRSRRVVVVGGGPVAASKLDALLTAGADVTVIAPEVRQEIEERGVTVVRRPFEASDLDGAWWVVAAAPKEVNRQVLEAAEERRVFVNAVDDPAHATAYLGGVVRRQGVTVAISTNGRAPALAGLLREALDAWLPGDLDDWLLAADEARRQWKAQGVPMDARRPQLLEILNKVYEGRTVPSPQLEAPTPEFRVPSPEFRVPSPESRAPSPGSRAPSPGSVALVGAGPGDPGLWTVRAVRLLEEADLVLYDALVDVSALRRTTKAQCFSVGKRARRDSVPQDTINRLMIRGARQGKRVVRLKGGDPFVFGRGGEEALALAIAGVACEVVPGVTTAVAAPELAGIPVTHRGIASGFLVLAGHTSEAVDNTLRSVRPNSISIVMLMSVTARGDLASRLMAHGWSADTPAALVCAASTPDAWTWTGPLAQIGSAAPPAGLAGVLVVGEVVRLRDVLSQSRPSTAPGESGNEVSYGRHG